MKRLNRILIVFSIIILLTSTFCNVFATINPDNYKPNETTIYTENSKMKLKFGVILGVVRNISVVVSVVVLMVIGVKYMFGSVEEKASYKASMMPYVIGCIMASAGTTLVSYIYNIMHE